MSAILSADDLNDFISPGVACIKPVETLPAQQPEDANPYEVTTEDKVAAANPPPAQISLTDCLACSGCVTSAEAVLVSLQSHTEVLHTLDDYNSLPLPWEGHGSGARGDATDGVRNGASIQRTGKIFVASVSPQSRASLAALYGISSAAADRLIKQLLSGPDGLASTGPHGSHFALVLDTNVFRELALVLAADEALAASDAQTKKPILTSACPGWICYAEKTHPHILPHLSQLKSPQALAGTFVKSVLCKKYNVDPGNIWHLAIMPCFDKKLEASRAELTSGLWEGVRGGEAVRDVDCVITVRELLNLAEARGISLPILIKSPTRLRRPRIPDQVVESFLFPRGRRKKMMGGVEQAAGTSGGYLWHVLSTVQANNPGSRIDSERGRNADVVEYKVVQNGAILFKAARYYGFRNIQNLVRRLKPAKASRLPGAARRPGGAAMQTQSVPSEYGYVEVMACPGGCTNGGGQIKAVDLGAPAADAGENKAQVAAGGMVEQKQLLAKVDEAYWSASSESDNDVYDSEDGEGLSDAMDIDEAPPLNGLGGGEILVNGVSSEYNRSMLQYWAGITGVDPSVLVFTTYRAVESDVGKNKGKTVSDVERVAGLASSIGGGW